MRLFRLLYFLMFVVHHILPQTINLPQIVISTPATMKSTSQAKPLRNIKRVRFSETSTLVITRPKTRQELNSSWYTQSEIQQFKQCATHLAKQVLQTQSSIVNEYINHSLARDVRDFQSFCGVEQICGIEHLLSLKICEALLASRYRTIKDVLQEQARQRREEVCDFEMLAAVSVRTSFFPKLWRHNIAVLNQTHN